jgi:uncharacterized protein YnzC (UPF0291/DUF896 family)
MADDNDVEIHFGASTDDALAGIAQVRDSLAGLTAPVAGLGSSLGRLSEAFGAALPADKLSECAKAFADMGTAAQRSAAQVKAIGTEIKVLQQGAAQKKIVLDAEVSQFQITQDQKFALLEAETQKEYQAQLALLEQEAGLDSLSLSQRQNVIDRIAELEAKHRTDMLRLDEQSIAAQQALWNGYLSSLTSAFNSQIRGLLEGTTSWQTAMKKVLEDLTIKFIEMAEQMVVKWLAAEIAQTTATTTGAAARAAADESASSTGILANAAAAMRAIMTDAGQAFAGVFAFLAPTMGPAAAGPAAAAQASVSAAAIFDVGTDYVVRGGLALIHPGETIVPAARGSGPYTGANMGAQIHAPVSINVSALDSQSVARFFNDNSRHMLRAINDAVKRGAHLGLRAVNP